MGVYILGVCMFFYMRGMFVGVCVGGEVVCVCVCVRGVYVCIQFVPAGSIKGSPSEAL